LWRIQADHDLAVSRDDRRGIFRSNQRFHEALFALCGNQVLAQAIHEYARRTHAIRFGALSTPEQQQRSLKEHHDLLRALENGQRETLIELAHTHLLPSRDRYLSLAKARDIVTHAANSASRTSAVAAETGTDVVGRGEGAAQRQGAGG